MITVGASERGWEIDWGMFTSPEWLNWCVGMAQAGFGGPLELWEPRPDVLSAINRVTDGDRWQACRGPFAGLRHDLGKTGLSLVLRAKPLLLMAIPPCGGSPNFRHCALLGQGPWGAT